MDPVDRYQVDLARDNHRELLEVLQHISTRKSHVRIVSVTWQPSRPNREGGDLSAGYTIISERGEVDA